MLRSLSRFVPARRRAGQLAFLAALTWALPVLSVQAHSKERGAGATSRSEPLTVVTSFSVLADMARHVGGDKVKVVSIIGPQADAHNFEPRPQDVKSLAKADVFVINGLAFESWAPRLIQSSRFQGVQVVASNGARLRTFDGRPVDEAGENNGATGNAGTAELTREHTHPENAGQNGSHAHDDHDKQSGVDAHDDHDKHGDNDKHDSHDAHDGHDGHDGHAHAAGEIDPHAWQDLRNAAVYVKNIAQALAAVDPSNAALYQENARHYTEQILALDEKLRQAFNDLPPTRRKVVTAHNAFGYFADAYGVQFIPVSGLAGQAETSAQRFAELVDTIRREQIAGIFTEQGSNARLVEQIARETRVRIGKPLFSDALAARGEPGDTYLGMMQWNLDQMLQVLKN